MIPPIDPSSVILYVQNPLASADFYAALLGRPPVEASPGFVMFTLAPGVMLGLWARDDVAPAPAGRGAASELAIVVADKAAVNARHAEWAGWGWPIAQAPTAMDFGFTFVATDPDGHRLRVFAPGAA